MAFKISSSLGHYAYKKTKESYPCGDILVAYFSHRCVVAHFSFLSCEWYDFLETEGRGGVVVLSNNYV